MADDDLPALDRAAHAEAGQVDEADDLGKVGRAGRDRATDGMLRGALQGRCQASYVVDGLALAGRHLHEHEPAGGDGACLVEHDGVDPAGVLQDLRSADQDAELGTTTGADHQRRRRGQPERAGAGDDQHGHGGGERGRRAGSSAEPEAERASGDGDDNGDEDARDPVGQPLDVGLAVLGGIDEAGHLGQLGVGADPGSSDDEPAADVDRGTGDGVARRDLDRHGLPGQHRGVDGRASRDDDAVGGDALAGADHELVPDPDIGSDHPCLDAVPEHTGVFDSQLEQGAQGLTGRPLGAFLEVATGQQERGHARGGLEIDGVQPVGALDRQPEGMRHPRVAGRAQEERHQRPAEGGEHAERHERVHRGRGVPQVGPRRAMEGPGAPHGHRCGEGERRPLPVGELQRGDHPHRDHGCGQQGAYQEPLPQVGQLGLVSVGWRYAGGGPRGV